MHAFFVTRLAFHTGGTFCNFMQILLALSLWTTGTQQALHNMFGFSTPTIKFLFGFFPTESVCVAQAGTRAPSLCLTPHNKLTTVTDA